MLKACWDCISGFNENRERQENGDAYGTRLSGNTQNAPLWPNARYENENMFVIPRQLNSGDQIDVSGVMTHNCQSVTVNLVTGNSYPDDQNIACQVETSFSANNDRVAVRIKQNGYVEEISGDHQNLTATDFFTSSNFTFSFSVSVSSDSHSLTVNLGDNYLTTITLKHRLEDIRFLTLYGDIEKITKLNFVFG
ncbi:uncharacterized protein LOC113231681 [Hyposmocoma kahamanoa]|uniref:uncharacterized protein LOC113231681 n=1 Tax=Hyposmocoma kahamanoa TaxID=1477025 RepID=UPI000E6D62F3|nr:uncharacterized protein LOC113231681 [Hyposmocoma kahamanoa]